MTYEEAVKEGRILVKRSDQDMWALAKLTYEHAAPNKGSKNDTERVSLAQWARDIGISKDSARRWYHRWERERERDGSSSHALPSWHSAVEKDEPNLIEQRAASAVKQLSEEAKNELVIDLVKDDSRLYEVVTAPEVYSRVLEVVHEVEEDNREKRESRPSKKNKTLEKLIEEGNIMGALSKIQYSMEAIEEKVGEIHGPAWDMIHSQLVNIANMVDSILSGKSRKSHKMEIV